MGTLWIIVSLVSLTWATKTEATGYCNNPVHMPEIKLVNKTSGTSIIMVLRTTFEEPKLTWFTKDETQQKRFIPLNIRGSFYVTQTKVGQEHIYALHTLDSNFPRRKWQNIHFYLTVKDACHNIHFLVGVNDASKIIKAKGTFQIPTILRVPMKRYYPTVGKAFMMAVETSGKFGAPFFDLNDRTAVEATRLNAASAGYSFFERAMWNDIKDIGVRFRSGKSWLSWEEQYPQKRPGNAHIVSTHDVPNDNQLSQGTDRRMVVFDPFTEQDIGIYETRLRLGLKYSIQIRIYSELAMVGVNQMDQFPAVTFLPCDLYPNLVDAELMTIHPADRTVVIGMAKNTNDASQDKACILELSTHERPREVVFKDDNGRTQKPSPIAEVDYGTIWGRYYEVPAPRVGNRINYTYEDNIRVKKISIASYKPVKLKLDPNEVDYEKKKGKDLKIKCTASGIPRPTVIFKRKAKSGRFLPMVSSRYKTRLQMLSKKSARATLTITKFSYQDAFPPYEWGARGFLRTGIPDSMAAKGNYGIYCFADNEFSKVAEVVSIDHGKEDMKTITENSTTSELEEGPNEV